MNGSIGSVECRHVAKQKAVIQVEEIVVFAKVVHIVNVGESGRDVVSSVFVAENSRFP